MNKRQNQILNFIAKNNKASVNELAQTLKVSSVTIRQDLTELEHQGLLKRVHGGAVLEQTDDLSHRLTVQYENKLSIACIAASMVDKNETILIESGSANALLARELSARKNTNLTIITCNTFISSQISKQSSINVLLLGGIYQPESQSLVGAITKQNLNNLNFTKAFIGIDGFSIESGFTSQDMMRIDIQKAIIETNAKVFVLTDATKFGKTALASICSINEVDTLITDCNIPKQYKEYFQKSKIDLVLADL